MNPSKSAVAVIMIVLSSLALATMDASTKYIGSVVSIVLVLWSRYTIQAGIMGMWLWQTRGGPGFRTAHPRFQVLRGVLLLLVSALAVLSLQYIPLAEFTAIAMLSPLLVTAISSRMLNHDVGRRRWILLCCGFLGTVIMLRPGSDLFGLAAVLPLMATLMYAIYCVLTSRIATLDSPYTSQFYTGITGCLGMFPLLALQSGTGLGGLFDLPSAYLGVLLLMGLSGTAAHLLIVMAFSQANAATLMPFVYVQIGFAAVMSWLVFHHTPDFWTWVGMLIIAACGMATVWLNVREAQRIVAPVNAFE